MKGFFVLASSLGGEGREPPIAVPFFSFFRKKSALKAIQSQLKKPFWWDLMRGFRFNFLNELGKRASRQRQLKFWLPIIGRVRAVRRFWRPLRQSMYMLICFILDGEREVCIEADVFERDEMDDEREGGERQATQPLGQSMLVVSPLPLVTSPLTSSRHLPLKHPSSPPIPNKNTPSWG